MRAHVSMCVYNHDQIIQIKLRTLIMSRCRRLKNGSFYERNKLIMFYLNEIVLLYSITAQQSSHTSFSLEISSYFIYLDEGFIQKFHLLPSIHTHILINIASMNACYTPQNQLVLEGGILMSFLLIIAVPFTLNFAITPTIHSHLQAHVN